MSARSLPGLFFAQAEARGDALALRHKVRGVWSRVSWREYAASVRRVADALVGAGLAPGDRVAILGENRPEWLIADHAIMAAGAITVPAFTTNTAADHQHVLTHSGATGVIISGKAIARRLLPAAIESPVWRGEVRALSRSPAL